nr:hypothetical protein [Tanacetum cinerariifolium]
MALTFADTHNIIAYRTKLDASEGFDQIINFLKASSIKYALTINPNIYVSCIKQFWTYVSVVNDVTRLQALVDKKKVIITEDTIRDALRLNDAESIDCLPNEEIVTELSTMSYEKPSTKLTFYKAFFSPQWKFLIHTILQCMSAKRTSWNEFISSMALAVICLSTGRKFNFSKYIFDSLVRNADSSTKFNMYPRFLQLMIRAQVGNLSLHSTKYSSPALTQKVFANMRSVGKGFSKVDTPLFEGIIVAQQVDESATEVNINDVLTTGVTDEGVADVNANVVLTAVDEPSIPSSPPTIQPPPPPSQDLPSTSQDAKISMDLLHTLLERCTTLIRRVEHLEQDKIAQALEITKLKQRVKKLERRNKLKVSQLRRLKKVGTAQRVDTSDDTVMDDVSKQERIIATMDAYKDVSLKDVADIVKEVVVDAEIKEGADVQGRQAESQAQIYQINLEHADKVLSMQDVEVEPAELQEVVGVVTTDKLMTEVVTAASATITAVDTPIPAATITVGAPTLTTAPSAARRRNEVVIRDPKETATPAIIIHSKAKSKHKGKGILVEEPKQDKAFARELEAELNKIINWDDVIDQVQRKEKEDNVVIRNMAGFKMDYFKGMKYDDIRLIFKKYFNFNVAFLEKTKEQMEEEDSRALKRANESQAEKAAKNRNLEVLWELVKERFASSKPKNFSDDFLLTTLTYMFEKPDVQAQVWKNQRKVHGLAKVKSWRLLESYGVYIITFTSTQMILLVERRYPLSRFTLDQMPNNVRLEVEEESEVSLELLRFLKEKHQVFTTANEDISAARHKLMLLDAAGYCC